MKDRHFKYVIIGGGSAGYAAARTALEYTDSVAVIDGSDELGGLCILRGCMPSKTLIYAAEVLHLAQKGEVFGFKKGREAAEIDMKALQERKRHIIADFAEYRQGQLNSGNFTLFRENGKFVDQQTMELKDGTRLTGDNFLIATGSRVAEPPLPGLSEVPYITSDDVLELEEVPDSVIVLGGGVVASELAQLLLRLGSKVTMIQRSPHILSDTPIDAAEVVEQAFRDEGMELYTHTAIKDICHKDGEVSVTFEHPPTSEPVTVKASTLFNALGRNPNTDSLGLENTGVHLDDKGQVVTNHYQQSSVSHIYAAGDCSGPFEIVHVAILQAETATKHAFKPGETEPLHYHDLTHVVFTDPQVGIVGRTEDDLKAEEVPYLSAQYPFNDHGKSILMEANYGHVKVLAHKKTRKVLGAQCVSKDASELIHSLATGITLEATVDTLLKVHWYHPTLSEIWSYPLEEISETINKET